RGRRRRSRASSSVIQTETRATSAEAAASTARAFFAVAAAGATASAEAADASVSRAGEAASPAFSGASSPSPSPGLSRAFSGPPSQPAPQPPWWLFPGRPTAASRGDQKATADAADEHEAAAAAASSAVAVDGWSAGLTTTIDSRTPAVRLKRPDTSRLRGRQLCLRSCCSRLQRPGPRFGSSRSARLSAAGWSRCGPSSSLGNSCVMLSLLDSMTLSMSTAFHTSAPASDPSDLHAWQTRLARSRLTAAQRLDQQLSRQSWMEAELGSLMMRLLTVGSSRTGPEELMKRLQLASACGYAARPQAPETAFLSLSRNHEYTKHGRCASVDSRFNSTLKYFQSALSVYLKYNVSKIVEAVNSAFGYKPEIDCFAPGKKHGEKSKPAYLAELRICFSKDLTPRECESSGREVPQPRRSAHTLYYDPELPRSFHREDEANVYSPIKVSRNVKNLIASWIETEKPTAVSGRKRVWTYPCKDDEDVQLPEKLNY
uniref:CAP10 domain-containing protein n=1 Tax=Macrostomum lignano TaxID=282301 RepID=A0A1I8FSW5_9PLAT